MATAEDRFQLQEIQREAVMECILVPPEERFLQEPMKVQEDHRFTTGLRTPEAMELTEVHLQAEEVLHLQG